MYTPVGKFLRNLRLSRTELLYNMAKKLEVSTSYLSLVETGKKAIPESWVDRITETYNLSDVEIDQFKLALNTETDKTMIEVSELVDKGTEPLFDADEYIGEPTKSVRKTFEEKLLSLRPEDGWKG